MVDIRQNEQHKDTFLAINPKGALPVLELDDGRHIYF
jgi:glutathione S-transferase